MWLATTGARTGHEIIAIRKFVSFNAKDICPYLAQTFKGCHLNFIALLQIGEVKNVKIFVAGKIVYSKIVIYFDF